MPGNPALRFPVLSSLVCLSGLLAGGHALAQDVPAQTITLPSVQVSGSTESATGPVQGYMATRSASGTKTDTLLRETPQAITVVTRDQIVEQGALNVQDALNYAAGVRPNAYGVDSRGDYVRVRGASPEQYLDGLRQFFSYNNPRTDIYALERIEVLRGPASMLYGQGSTGGVLNLVSKRPQAETQGEFGVVLGNHQRKEIQADLTGTASEDGQWLYRIVALGRDSDTQVQHVSDDRYLVAPSLTWQPSAATSITLQTFWQKDKSGSSQAFLPWSGTVLDNPNGQIPTRRFVSEPGFDSYDTRQFSAGWLAEHRFNDTWKVRQNFRHTTTRVDYRSLYPDVYSNPNAPFINAEQTELNRFYYVNLPRMRTLQADQNLEGKLHWGQTEHTVLMGMDYSRYRESGQTASGMGSPLDVYQPVYENIPVYALSDTPDVRQQQLGFYAQDQIRFLQNWILVAGVRYDRSESTVENSPTEKDHATTKRIGLIYAADNGWSPYVSYSESFTPVSGINFYGQRWIPLRGKQVEAGVKYMPDDGDLSFTAAAYNLREENRQVDDPSNPMNKLQNGSTETRGIELEARGRISPQWDVIANYNYTDIDAKLEGLPRHVASLWSKYRFGNGALQGFSVGAGVRYLSAFNDGNAPETPSLTLFDAALAYDTGAWRYAVNINNLADKSYSAVCLRRGDCFYGARRTVVVSAAYRY